ncbi:MAG: DUF3224 domain-containing protein [Vicinamibacteria bacterium]
MTGCMRPLDRAELERDLVDRIRAGRERTDERMVLVSTQAIEAGADFDFDALVTECPSLDALRQRFGRLDRLGELRTTEAVVLVGSSDVIESGPPDPIYGNAIRETWRWLQASSGASADPAIVDFGINALEARLAGLTPVARSRLVTPRRSAPVLVGSHLDRWVQTSLPPSADPDVAPFLHGPDGGAPDVHVVWRADVDSDMLDDTNLEEARGVLEVAPPSALEALSLPPLWVGLEALSVQTPRGESREGAAMRSQAKGTFEVKLTPVAEDGKGVASARIGLDKTFQGDLVGTGRGEMWTADTSVEGSGGYVAIEKIGGTLSGRSGGFTLLHLGTMRRGGDFKLTIVVVDDSGTGELSGLTGTMSIIIADGKHFYELDYTLPAGS